MAKANRGGKRTSGDGFKQLTQKEYDALVDSYEIDYFDHLALKNFGCTKRECF